MRITKYKNLIFDTEEKTMEILKGSIGTYSYLDISICEVVYEKANQKGKTPPFSHKVRDGSLGFITWSHNYVWCGLRFTMKDGFIHYVYISDEGSPWLSLNNHADTKKAKEALTFINKIIFKRKNG